MSFLRNRWTRLGLVVMALFAVAVCGVLFYRHQRQAAVIAGIKAAGGHVDYFWRGSLKWWPLGRWFDPPMVSVYAGPQDPDEVLRLAAQLRHVDNVWILDAPATARGLVHLEKFGPVQLLSIQSVPMGDDALPYVAKMRELECFMVARTEMSTGALRQLLGQMPRTQVLVADDVLDAHEKQEGASTNAQASMTKEEVGSRR